MEWCAVHSTLKHAWAVPGGRNNYCFTCMQNVINRYLQGNLQIQVGSYDAISNKNILYVYTVEPL